MCSLVSFLFRSKAPFLGFWNRLWLRMGSEVFLCRSYSYNMFNNSYSPNRSVYRMMFKSLKGLRGQSHKGVESTNHWISQRFTSILLIPLSILFVVNFVRVFDKPYIEVLKTFQHPVNNLVALLFILISLWHYRQGIEVVIEDYVHDMGKRNLTLRLIGIMCWFLVIVVIFSFVSIYRMEI